MNPNALKQRILDEIDYRIDRELEDIRSGLNVSYLVQRGAMQEMKDHLTDLTPWLNLRAAIKQGNVAGHADELAEIIEKILRDDDEASAEPSQDS